MARRQEKERALVLRRKGFSYSQIKSELGVSKSTLSGWLKDIPLSQKRMRELRDNSQIRIEKTRETKRIKREDRLSLVYKKVSDDLGELTDREFFVAGLFLYWAEGGKTTPYSISLSNTDPSMIRYYLKWLNKLQVPKDKVKIRLQLYKDMDINYEISFWSDILSLPKSCFRNPYIKKSNLSDVSFKGFGHGTCNAIVDSRDVAEYVHQGLKRISKMFS